MLQIYLLSWILSNTKLSFVAIVVGFNFFVLKLGLEKGMTKEATTRVLSVQVRTNAIGEADNRQQFPQDPVDLV